MVFGGENADSYYDEGVTAAMKGEIQHAVQCFQKAIKMDNSMAAAYHQLGKCYYRTGDFDKAIALLDQVARRSPNLIAARLDLGYALAYGGNLDAARQHFDAIVALEPNKGRGLLGLAQVCFLEGNWQGAMSFAQNAVAVGGSNFATLYLLGRAARLAGNLPLSDSSLEQADNLIEKSFENADSPESYYLRGEVHFAREQFANALEQYRAAADRAQPDKTYSAFGQNFGHLDILCKQGLCYQRLGQTVQASAIGKTILTSDPGHKLGRALANL